MVRHLWVQSLENCSLTRIKDHLFVLERSLGISRVQASTRSATAWGQCWGSLHMKLMLNADGQLPPTMTQPQGSLRAEPGHPADSAAHQKRGQKTVLKSTLRPLLEVRASIQLAHTLSNPAFGAPIVKRV